LAVVALNVVALPGEAQLIALGLIALRRDLFAPGVLGRL
jgi:hypothetical protein